MLNIKDRSIPVFQYLIGFKDFQLISHEVSGTFGMVSQKERWTIPEEADQKKNISLIDANEVLEMAATRQLIGRILTLHGSMRLDIKAGSMTLATAAAVHDTLLSGLAFVIDYFNYT